VPASASVPARTTDASHRPRASGASASPVATESLYGAPARTTDASHRPRASGASASPVATESLYGASAPSPSSRPPSYLEGVPRDHSELVSALLQVLRGAAKDIKTLVTQAVEMSHQRDDPFNR
jgi:hypothetical protein